MKKNTGSNKKVAKIFSIASLVLLILCAAVLVYSTISYSQKGLVSFFNYSFHVIQTKSMEPEINAGDLVIVKQVPYEEIQIGDNILFKCEDTTLPVYGRYIVHKVVAFTETPGVYITKGVNNPNVDNVPSKAEGKAVAVSAFWGKVFSFLTGWKSVVMIVAFAGIIVFMVFEIISVAQNASELKKEKNKKKLNGDEKLKEKLKEEVLEEIKKEEREKSKQNKSSKEDVIKNEDGSDNR